MGFVNRELLEENEQLADLFGEISPLLATEQMQQLNLEVVETFLRDNGFIG